MSIFLDKKKGRSLTDVVYQKIRNDIINGRIQQGHKLSEIKLANDLSMSRTPVREALKQLEMEGLIDSIPNRGAIVVGVTDQDMKDLNTIRQTIEVVAMRLVVERISDTQIKELEDIFELMTFYTRKGDIDKLIELNTSFHEMIYDTLNSPQLEMILRHSQDLLLKTRYQSLNRDGRIHQTLEEHGRILEAIKTRNAEMAADEIIKHNRQLEYIFN